MQLILVPIEEIATERWDEFILSPNTNGEFINTHKYLSYHPEGRFVDKSVGIIDEQSGNILCVFPAVLGNGNSVISHMGTSFAGPIFDLFKSSVVELLSYMDSIENHYQSLGFQSLDVRTSPVVFSKLHREDILWAFWKRGYCLQGISLGNIVDLSAFNNEENLFYIYESKRRNHVRKSLRDGGFSLCKAEMMPESLWNNLEKNLSRKFDTSPTHTFKEIQDLMNRFPDRIEVLYSEDIYDGLYGAMAVIYKYKQVFHTQYLDMNYSLSSRYPNLYLIHHLLIRAKEAGFRWFSFGPSTERWGDVLNKGLFNYKNQFANGTITYPRFVKSLDSHFEGGME
mgnify:CR=1 FL=1